MSFITTADGTNIFYKDWGAGRPVLFSHGWPLSGDACRWTSAPSRYAVKQTVRCRPETVAAGAVQR
jgi:pimeloyl-ACP methyl ester carboxylesterase